MGKYLKNEKKGSGKKILVIFLILAALAAAVASYLLLDPSDVPDPGKDTAPEQTQNAAENSTTDPNEETELVETAPVETLPALEYPLVLENGGLQIENLFQYEGMNPDCDYEEGKDVASAMLKNTSDAYLEEAKITLTLIDGTVVNFAVNDLPAGKTVMVFDTANTSVEADALCADASCEAKWNPDVIPLPEEIGLTVDGVAVTVTNNTGRDISELVVYCRCPLDEDYFGGIAYLYTINDLPANESTTVDAWDCLLGMAEVVRVAVNHE